jgi:hypothetical protein
LCEGIKIAGGLCQKDSAEMEYWPCFLCTLGASSKRGLLAHVHNDHHVHLMHCRDCLLFGLSPREKYNHVRTSAHGAREVAQVVLAL